MKQFLLFLIIVFHSSVIHAQVKDSIVETLWDNQRVVKRNDRFLLMDSIGNILADCDSIYRPLKIDREYLMAKKGQWGVISFQGKERIPYIYDYIRPMYYSMFIEDRFHSEDDSKDIFLVQKNRKLGEIDFQNNIVLPMEYEAITDWVEYGPEGHYVQKNGKIGLIKHNTEVVIPPIYDSLYVEHFEDLIKAKSRGKYGVINSDHKVLIPFIYDGLIIDAPYEKRIWSKFDKPFFKRYVVKTNNEWLFLNRRGRVIRRGITQKEIEELYVSPGSIHPNFMLNNYDFEYIGRCMIKPKKI